MTLYKKIDWFLWLLLLLFIIIFLVVGISGCALVKPITDFIVAVVSNPTPIVNDIPIAALHSKLNWLSVVSIIGIALSAAAFINGQIKLAVPFFCGCAAALGMSLVVIKYSSFLAIGSLIAAVCIFAYSILIKNRAIKELILGAQELKGKIDPVNGSTVLFNNQTPPTRGMVNRIKDALKLKGKL